MEYTGLGFLLVLPLVVVVISLMIFIPIVLSRYKSAKKENQRIEERKMKILNEIQKEMGIENLKKGHKEIMDALTKKDIKDMFK
jgi:uncharacterized membrane protein YqiK